MTGASQEELVELQLLLVAMKSQARKIDRLNDQVSTLRAEKQRRLQFEALQRENRNR